MSSAAIRAIIFDIGRVLVRIDLRRAQLGLAQGLSLTPEELWSAIEKDPRWPDWQEGRISPHDWHLHLCQHLGMSLSFEQFTAAWNLALDPQPIHPLRLFQELSKRYRLVLLSNTDPIHVAYLESTYDFYQCFPKGQRIYSCSVGASKPDALIYREAVRAAKVRAGEAVFIDDVAANVEAARQLGLAGIHYQSPHQLLQAFAALGIKVEQFCTT
ncbi:MAG TPA: HAD family phosphatase [Verrucomicrobiae bacterium]|nr:HAD family phosphatase [Verrucomicrobiae bacterium]